MNNNKTLTAIQRRLLEEKIGRIGENLETKSTEELALTIIADLEEQFSNSKSQNKKISKRKFISRMIKAFKFGRMQAKLLRILAKSKVIESNKLKEKIGKCDFKSLIKDTRKNVKKYGGSDAVKLRHYRANKKEWWFLEIIPQSK